MLTKQRKDWGNLRHPFPASQDACMPSPNVTRSRIVLEIAAEMVAGRDRDFQQASVLFRRPGNSDWQHRFASASTREGLDAVIRGEADLAMLNPAAALTVAYRGQGPFAQPQPVRTIAVIPSNDQFVFAVKSDTGLTMFEDIAAKRYPLRVSIRGQLDHCLQFMLEDIAAAAGFKFGDLAAWGGEIRREGSTPHPGDEKFQALENGEIDAIFDEAAESWLDGALDAGMTVLPLSEETVRKLEAMGYRRAVLKRDAFPKLLHDILTIDFSGWPIFVHAQAADKTVAQICAALEARKYLVLWDGEGPLPVERMCREAPDTPQDVPLHPAAEAFWRERGYLG
jgi:TRAP-type uncharacterized transport system substrate-binding protein